METPTTFNFSFTSDRVSVKEKLTPVSQGLNPHEVCNKVLDDVYDIHKAYGIFQSLAQMDIVRVLKMHLTKNQVRHTQVPYLFISHFKTDSLITINLGLQDYMDIVGVHLKHNSKPAMVFGEILFNSKLARANQQLPKEDRHYLCMTKDRSVGAYIHYDAANVENIVSYYDITGILAPDQGLLDTDHSLIPALIDNAILSNFFHKPINPANDIEASAFDTVFQTTPETICQIIARSVFANKDNKPVCDFVMDTFVLVHARIEKATIGERRFEESNACSAGLTKSVVNRIFGLDNCANIHQRHFVA